MLKVLAHKVHPKIYRIRGVEDWQAKGFYYKSFPQFLEEDFKIREFLEDKLKAAGLADIVIERFPGKINIVIESIRPGFVIGRGGGNVEDLRREIEKIMIKVRKKIDGSVNPLMPSKEAIKIEVRELRNPWVKASLVGKWVADQLEKRIPFRRTIKRALDKTVANKEIKGARIEVAGRLDGREIARREWLQKGRMPRQTLRADIDYAQAEAYCTYGVIGVKVWIYKGERIE